MNETQRTDSTAKRTPGGFLFGTGVILAIVGFVLFVLGQSMISVVILFGGLILAVLGKLQTIAAGKRSTD